MSTRPLPRDSDPVAGLWLRWEIVGGEPTLKIDQDVTGGMTLYTAEALAHAILYQTALLKANVDAPFNWARFDPWECPVRGCSEPTGQRHTHMGET
jgi:hypothetical protein